MNGFVPFTIICEQCGHRNLPSRKIKESIQRVLTGEFNTCRKCGARFKKVRVPLRPLVKECLGDGLEISPDVILINYSGNTPAASGR